MSELCRYVRRDTNYHMTPLIVDRQGEKPALVEEALDAGADVVLAEPLSIKEVQHVVTMLVGQPEQGASAFQYTPSGRNRAAASDPAADTAQFDCPVHRRVERADWC